MGTITIVVERVVSPGTICATNGNTYVLRGVPDVEEDVPRFASAREAVEAELLGRELSFDEELARELPELPGTDIVAVDAEGTPVTPGLAAKVAGILANHRLRYRP